MSDIAIQYPPDFDLEESLYEAKGRLPVSVRVDGRTHRVCFYDPVRLAQDIETELESDTFFFESNVVVVPAVTRNSIEAAVERLARSLMDFV
jgi:hypothetical protein